MIINKDVISGFNPCSDRFNNYLEHYSDFNGSFDEFIDLSNITHDDKIWVAKRALNRNQLVHFGLLCAESVLNIFEAKYPEDKRVRECIEYLMTIKDFSNLTEEQKDEIRKHRYATYAAYSETYSATDAASYAASSAVDAVDAVDAGDSTYSAIDAASAAAAATEASAADAARKKQQELNLQLLKMSASL